MFGELLRKRNKVSKLIYRNSQEGRDFMRDTGERSRVRIHHFIHQIDARNEEKLEIT